MRRERATGPGHRVDPAENVLAVLRDLLDALDAVDEGARHYDKTGSTEMTVPAVTALAQARQIGRRHAPAKTQQPHPGMTADEVRENTHRPTPGAAQERTR